MKYQRRSNERRYRPRGFIKYGWGKNLGRWILYSLIFVLSTVAIIGGCGVLGAYNGIKKEAYQYKDQLQTLAMPKGFSTFVYDTDQNEIQKLDAADSNRVAVSKDKIPEDLGNAFVAVEDERFYKHNGVDMHGIIRAGYKMLSSGDMSQGASTITQQLIKNTVFKETWTNETKLEKIKRKIQEQFLAVQLEKEQDKETILVNYMNTIALGPSIYGVQAASKTYFGKDVKDLNLSECAVIAGITQNPSRYDPRRHPEFNKEKRDIVLDKMLAQKYIDQEAYDEAKADNVYDRIKTVNEETGEKKINSYFVDALIDDVINSLVEEGVCKTKQDAETEVYSGGLKIYSSLDEHIQGICDEIFANPENYPEGTKLYPEDFALTVRHKDGTVNNYGTNDLDKFMGGRDKMIFKSQEALDEAIEKFKASVVDEDAGDEVGENDIKYTYSPQPQVSLTVADQKTGQIVAIIGGRGEKTGNRTLNRATQAKRQPGSTFKVLSTFAPGIDHGDLTLATTFKDAEFHYADGKPVKNHWGSQYRGLQSVRYAIIKSANVLTVEAYTYITPQLGFDYLTNKFHLTTLTETDGQNQATCLGGIQKGVYNYELNAAYAAIANGGIYNKPHFYQKVVDHDGNTLLDNTAPKGEQILKETSAYLLTSAMKDVVTKGTGTKLNFGKTDIAGKTGTTSKNVDVWFAGFTNYYTATAWAGFDNNVYLASKGPEHNLAQTMWRKTMEKIHEDLPEAHFEAPDGIVKMSVCAESGLRPIDGCNPVTEIFASDNLPGESEVCDVHGGDVGAICLIDHKPATALCPFKQPGLRDPRRLEKIQSGFKDPLNFGGGDPNNQEQCHHTLEFMLQPGSHDILRQEWEQSGNANQEGQDPNFFDGLLQNWFNNNGQPQGFYNQDDQSDAWNQDDHQNDWQNQDDHQNDWQNNQDDQQQDYHQDNNDDNNDDHDD